MNYIEQEFQTMLSVLGPDTTLDLRSKKTLRLVFTLGFASGCGMIKALHKEMQVQIKQQEEEISLDETP